MSGRNKDDNLYVKLMTSWWGSLSLIKNHLCSCSTYHEKYMLNISFRAISCYNKNFELLGCHISGNLPGSELNGNPDQKSNVRFFLFMLKNLEIWNLFFRVPKIGISGLPYLRRDSLTFSNMHIKSKHFSCPLIWHWPIF